MSTGSAITFDIYISALNLVFEYHGFQHYYDHFIFGISNSLKDRDNERREKSKSLGLTYVEIPYWWHQDKESIISLLHRIRPDIIPTPPEEFIPFSY